MRKLIIDLDPGIGDAVAAVLAMLDPEIDLLALTATAGAFPGGWRRATCMASWPRSIPRNGRELVRL